MSDTAITIRYLNEEDMIKAGVLDAPACIETIEEVLGLLSDGDVLMGGKNHREHGIQLIFPRKSPIKDFPLEDSPDRRFMSMPGYLGGRFHMAGEKYYGSNGRNVSKGLPRSILMCTLSDVETGAPVAYMSANLLSAMRTGAVPAVMAKYCAKEKINVITLLGTGEINRACLRCFAAMYPDIKTVKLKGSSPASKSAAAMKDFIEEKFPQIENVIICDTLEEACRDTDIISEAVSTINRQWPVVDPAWLSPGTTIISSGTMDFTSHDFIANHMKKVVDNKGMYDDYVKVYQEYDKDGQKLSTGTPGIFFSEMIANGRIKDYDVTEIGDIIRGRAKGRTNDDDIYLISAGGMPILDIGWGYECYNRAKKNGIGTELKLWDSPYMGL
jgi:ornithine cyclodeaminase/alanine dehydrogenase-like protein (mu-crystallin family)